jgi:hypothetical protein
MSSIARDAAIVRRSLAVLGGSDGADGFVAFFLGALVNEDLTRASVDAPLYDSPNSEAMRLT